MSLKRHATNRVFYYRKMINGVLIWKSTRTTNEREAQRIASKWESEAYADARGFGSRELRFGEWWETFKTLYMDRYKQPRDFERVVGKILGDWRQLPLSKIKPPIIEAFVARRLREGAAPGTVGLERRLLKIIFDEAVDNEKLARSPFTRRSVGLRSPKRKRILSRDEEVLLFAQFKPNKTVVFRFLLITGLRAAELLGLKLKDLIQIPAPGIRVLGKGSKTRVVPLSKEGVELVPKVIEALKSRGNVLSRKSLLQSLQGAAERAKIEPITLHDLRRTFATRRRQGAKKMELESLSAILGHASVSTTAGFYVELTNTQHHQELVDSLEADGYGGKVEDGKTSGAK